MIFPWLRGILSPALAPITFLLFALNLLVFVGTLDVVDEADKQMDTLFSDRPFMETQGLAFSTMITREPQLFTATLRELAEKSLSGDHDSRRVMGSLAIRNNVFMDFAAAFDFKGDEIALRSWREKFSKLVNLQREHPSYAWGLSRVAHGWRQYVTYQFSHSGALHLFWNMLFLLLFGCFVEAQLGSSIVALTYIGAGLFGAFVFSKLSGISSSPLVGASASVSGLMALVGVYWFRREKVKFFFWLLPADGYFGFVSLPSWIVILISLVPDLSGYLGNSSDFGSVAYSAHIGGAVWGAVMAGLLYIGWLVRDPAEVKKPEESGRRNAA